MSNLLVTPELVAAAAADLAGIGSAIGAANAAAGAPTMALLAAGADEVSAAVAAVFSSYAQQYQALSAAAAAFHDQFVRALAAGAGAYAGAEAANVEQQLLNAINAPTLALLGRPLIGNGADGAAGTGQAGGAGGLLYGNGGNGGSGAAGQAPASERPAPGAPGRPRVVAHQDVVDGHPRQLHRSVAACCRARRPDVEPRAGRYRGGEPADAGWAGRRVAPTRTGCCRRAGCESPASAPGPAAPREPCRGGVPEGWAALRSEARVRRG